MAGEIGWVSLLRILVGLDSIRDYRPVLHMVRHPLLAIRSMQTHHYTLLEQLSNVLHFQTTTPLGKYMEYWLAWNQIAEHLAEYTFCIERFPYCYDEVCSRLGIAPISEVLLNVPTDLGHRLDEEPHWFEKDMTWEQLAEHGPDLAKRVRELANHYGYKAAPPRPVGPH